MNNILVYRDCLLAGSETFILNQAEALRSYNPYYVGLSIKQDGLKTPPERTILLSKGKNRRSDRARITLFGPRHDDLKKLQALNPVLIHAHFGLSASRAMMLAKTLQVPLIVTFHGWDAIMPDKMLCRAALGLRVYVWRQKIMCKIASRVICVSNFLRPYVLSKGFSDKQAIVHYTGIDTDLFEPDASVPRGPVVLFVGRLEECKGCHYLIRAMKFVQEKLPEAELVVIGYGPRKGDLEREAHRQLHRYRFLGYQTPHVIRHWMNRARVFCGPSFAVPEWQETFGMVFGEAQSMGLPVVSFASGAIPEVVEHGSTGFIASEHDVSTLSEYIIRLLSDHDMWRKMSIACRNRVLELYDLRTQTEALETIYREVIEENSVAFPRALNR